MAPPRNSPLHKTALLDGRVSVPAGSIPIKFTSNFMSSDYWALNIPDHQQPVPAPRGHSASRPSADTGEQTILEQVAQILTAHPSIRVRLRASGSQRASLPTGSLLTEEVLRFAAHMAGHSYDHQPPMGRRLCPDRIQRLVLGVMELLQAELLDDPDCDLDQLDGELLAMLRCLRAGFQRPVNHGAPDASPSDDTEGHDDTEDDTDDDQ